MRRRSQSCANKGFGLLHRVLCTRLGCLAKRDGLPACRLAPETSRRDAPCACRLGMQRQRNHLFGTLVALSYLAGLSPMSSHSPGVDHLMLALGRPKGSEGCGATGGHGRGSRGHGLMESALLDSSWSSCALLLARSIFHMKRTFCAPACARERGRGLDTALLHQGSQTPVDGSRLVRSIPSPPHAMSCCVQSGESRASGL